MNLWLFIFLAWSLVKLTVHLVKHGQPVQGDINFFAALGITLAEIVLLALGGMFAVANGWFIVYLWWHIVCVVAALLRHGEPSEIDYTFGVMLFITILEFVCLGQSGFFHLLV